jgi:D-3-phosphoglycerate dehydrogenase
MKILITDKIADEAIQLFKDAGHTVIYNEMDSGALLSEIANFDALMIRSRTKVTELIISAGAKGKLKVIGRAGIGVDNIDIKKAGELGIKVVNSPSGATISVAELALAHMLSLSRFLVKADKSMKKGEWIKKQLKGNELYGKTLGLIGCGNIGKKTAEYARAFGMNIIGFDPYISQEDMKINNILKKHELKDLMKESDYISLHIPHVKQTHHLVNKEMISLMKKTAFLINCARGGTVDEKALYEALENKSIAGAALDVFEEEPPEKTSFVSLDNISLTPHIGANTLEGQIRAGTVCAEQIMHVLDGQEPEYWVNKTMMK